MMRNKIITVLSSLVLTIFILSLCSCGNAKSVLNNDKVSITVGDSYQLQISNYEGDVLWSSSDEHIAKVEDGKVTANTKGNAVISAVLSDGEKLSCDVTVKNIEVTSIKLDKSSISLKEGNSDQIEAKLFPSEAADELEWDSTNPSIVSVDNNGFITGISKGTAVIRCYTSNGKSASCSVKVTKAKSSTSSKSDKTSNGNTTIINRYDNSGQYDSNDPLLYCRASDWATLRSYNSRDAKSLAKIKRGESAVYISETTEFYYVAYQGKRGYVLKDYFSYSPNAPINYGNN
ncbi:MAG: Ig domain-containing protein [Ruminococcus sp.]|nr:Ig domain-containing protein [Ruminococcus sp.]